MRLPETVTAVTMEPAITPAAPDPVTILTIEEYRSITGDMSSSPELIRRRLNYLQTLCEHVIRNALERAEAEIRQESEPAEKPSISSAAEDGGNLEPG